MAGLAAAVLFTFPKRDFCCVVGSGTADSLGASSAGLGSVLLGWPNSAAGGLLTELPNKEVVLELVFAGNAVVLVLVPNMDLGAAGLGASSAWGSDDLVTAGVAPKMKPVAGVVDSLGLETEAPPNKLWG